jgi:hypothetical protein
LSWFSFVSLGGQSSRAAALDYLDQLQQIGIDLSQDFLVVSFCDFDPEGWTIPLEFVSHLELGITGNVTLVRAGTLREQLAESTINLSTVPYPIFDGNGKPNKAKLTKYSNFEAETGGLYILNSNGELVPARIEMDIYSSQHVLSKIVETLAPHLDGFDYQIREFKKALHSQYDQAVNELSSDISESISELYSDYFRAIREERNRIDLEIIKRGAEENAAIR